MTYTQRLLVLLLIQFVTISALRITPVERLKTYSYMSEVYLENPSLENICSFLTDLYVDLTSNYGCIRESPMVENSKCYTSSNLLAEYVLRNLCNKTQLANKVKAFLEKYKVDFYNYYQILLGRNFTLPLTTVEHVKISTVNGIEIHYVKRTMNKIHDYDEYADLLAYSTLYYLTQGDVGNAIIDLVKLNSLFDGIGFRDKAYSGEYETYKIALAVLVFKAINHTNLIEKYTSVLFRIKPLTTLYVRGEVTNELRGIGDLNVETVCLVAIALYSDLPYRIKPFTHLTEVDLNSITSYIRDVYTLMIIVLTLLITTLLLVIIILVLMLKIISRRSSI